MENKELTLQAMHYKISEGMALTFKKLVAYKAQNDQYLVFSDQEKIVKVAAKDIKL